MDASTSKDPSSAIQFRSSPGQPWHQNPRFHRYWQHYDDVRDWYYTHWFPELSMMQHSHHHMMPQYYGAGLPFMASGGDPGIESYGDWISMQHHAPYWQWGDQMDAPPHSGAAPVTQNVTADGGGTQKVTADGRETQNVTADGREIDSEGSEDSFDMEMEVSQEMKAFFAKSEKHREERQKEIDDLKQKIFTGEEQDYINAEDLYKASISTSHKPPTEKPGQKRRQEMKTLYGKDAAMIHGMETALQLQFDRNYDRKEPKLWPTIPLKLWPTIPLKL